MPVFFNTDYFKKVLFLKVRLPFLIVFLNVTLIDFKFLRDEFHRRVPFGHVKISHICFVPQFSIHDIRVALNYFSLFD